MEGENIGELLKRLLAEKGMSQRRLSILSGVDRGYINSLVRGKKGSITLRIARKFASALNEAPEIFLQSSAGPITPNPKAALRDLEVSISAYIPVFAEVCAGEGIEPIDYVACTRTRPAPESLRALRVKGLCLSPEIEEWDTLIVDTALLPQNGDLVICILDNEASVKRFVETETDKWLVNNDGKYQPEDVFIYGVVVELNRKRR